MQNLVLIYVSIPENLVFISFRNVTGKWEDFTESIWHGRCQTMRHYGKLEENLSLKVYMNASKSFAYRIYLHDPNFLLISDNPSNSPKITTIVEYEKAPGNPNQYLRAEKHILLNREGSPCTDYQKENSSFSQCVSKYFANVTGCRVGNIIWVGNTLLSKAEAS